MGQGKASLLLLLTVSSGVAPQAPLVAIRAGTLIDGTGAAPIHNAVILIEGERIKAIGANLAVPPGARIIDLSSATVMPGWIDAHTHLTSPTIGQPGWDADEVKNTPAHIALRAAGHAREVLESGFTTVRDVGGFWRDDIALRDAINRGWVVGPRIQASGYALSISGGHCDETSGYVQGTFGHEFGVMEGMANSVDQVREAVRLQVKYGSDVIKICATGGVMSWADSVGNQQFTEEEMKAAVETARMLERRVAAHAHGTAGIKAAIRAGVTSIEHGSLMDDEGIALMKEHGTYFVSTIFAGDAVARMAKAGKLPPFLAAKALAVGPRIAISVGRAFKAGVKIVFGTDNIFDPFADDWREFQLLVGAGLTPMDAIVAATKTASECLGWEKDIGTLTPGKYADVVAVEGDPLADITRMKSVRFVMKAGVVVKGAHP